MSPCPSDGGLLGSPQADKGLEDPTPDMGLREDLAMSNPVHTSSGPGPNGQSGYQVRMDWNLETGDQELLNKVQAHSMLPSPHPQSLHLQPQLSCYPDKVRLCGALGAALKGKQGAKSFHAESWKGTGGPLYPDAGDEWRARVVRC